MNAQALIMQMAEAVMSDDLNSMEEVLTDAETALNNLTEADADAAELLQGQLAWLRGVIAMQKAQQGTSDDLMAEVEAAERAGDDARLKELDGRCRAGHAAMMAYVEATLPTEEPLPTAASTLFDAIEDGDAAAVGAALASVDVNARHGEFEKTALYVAITCEDRSPDMVRLLLGAGADPRVGMAGGYTPLHAIGDYIYGLEEPEVVADMARILVDAGADIEARTESYGWTPLHRAVLEGRDYEVAALLRAGAGAAVPYAEHSLPRFTPGRLPLHMAASDLPVLRVLLDHGADPAARDAHGQTAAEYIRTELARRAGAADDEAGTEYVAELEVSLSVLEAQPPRQ